VSWGEAGLNHLLPLFTVVTAEPAMGSSGSFLL
jgi:hypothetical protein